MRKHQCEAICIVNPSQQAQRHGWSMNGGDRCTQDGTHLLGTHRHLCWVHYNAALNQDRAVPLRFVPQSTP